MSIAGVLTRFGKGAVGPSPDLDRILALPRRVPPNPDALVGLMTSQLRRENTACKCDPERGCIAQLLPVQAWALLELQLYRRLFGPIGVGHGKTGIDVLAAMVTPGVRTAVLLLPASLRDQFLEKDFPAWSEHFHTPNLAGGRWFTPGRPVLHVMGYEELGRENRRAWLTSLQPDLVIGDECHRLKNPDAGCTIRVDRLFERYPETMGAFMSGTITRDSIKDFAHILRWAYKREAPVPLHLTELDRWAEALDASDWPAPAGELSRLGGANARDGFRTRLHVCPGTVVSGDVDSCEASLVVYKRSPTIPDPVREALRQVREWERPDGDPLDDLARRAACSREVAQGFYYTWRFPRGEPVPVIEEWLRRRKAWAREQRDILADRVEHLDTPYLVQQAAERCLQGVPATADAPVVDTMHWSRWRDYRDRVQPETGCPVWVDDFLVRDAAEWGDEAPGVVWYDSTAFGEALHAMTGWPMYPGGTSPELVERGDRTVICAIDAHGTGKNLQMFSRALVVGPLDEQLVGRHHRKGQRADQVEFTIYTHTDGLRAWWDSAIRRRDYREGAVVRAPGKLSRAVVVEAPTARVGRKKQ